MVSRFAVRMRVMREGIVGVGVGVGVGERLRSCEDSWERAAAASAREDGIGIRIGIGIGAIACSQGDAMRDLVRAQSMRVADVVLVCMM